MSRTIEGALASLGRLWLQLSGPAAVISGPPWLFELANPICERLLGAKDLAGRPLQEALAGLPAEGPLLQLLDRTWASGQASSIDEYSVLWQEADGRIREPCFQLTCYPLRDEHQQISALLIVGMEVNTQVWERKRSRDRQLLEATLQQLPVGVVVTDPAGRVTQINQQARALLGEQLQEVEVLLDRARKTEQVVEEELDVPTGERPISHLLARATAIQDPEGQLVATVSVVTDITERSRAEQQERQARTQAEVANRTKDEFLAMLGHELRNPLTPIVTALHLMRLHGQDVFERERRMIERQIAHMVRLVDDLLDVSRITRGKVELRRQRTELSALVNQALEQASPLLEQRQHRLVIAVPDSGLLVDVDPVRLAQVIANLLNNAAKYTEPHGQITVRAQEEGHQVALWVIDNGIGLAEDILPHVFDLFVQGRQALDRAQGGLGLGLAIVRSLVEAHGGSVQAYSQGPGQGTQFVVRLPRAYGVDTPVDTPRVFRTSQERRRVLVVDDNVEAAELLAECLRASGHTAVIARDGPSALRVASDLMPEVAVLDIGLPVMDGYELARHLQQLPGLRGLQLIALTGYGQEIDRRRGEAAGFERWLVKPVDYEDLERYL